MRHLLISAIFLATGLLLVSCAESIEQSAQPKLSYIEHRELLTKAATDQLANGITRADVENYLSLHKHISSAEVKNISRFDIDQDAYVFIVNLKQGGWYLCSGDYSSVPVIAYSETGSLSFDGKQSRHTQGWLQTIREQIVGNRTSNSATVQANRNDWIRSKRVSLTRSGDDPDTTEVDVVLDLEVLRDDIYPGLTETTWDQGFPFNQSMPKRYNTTLRCIAGCTVVALAQLVYYTHNAFQFPNDIYSSASCDAYYNDGPPYPFVFSNQSTATWSDMPLTYDPNDFNTNGWSYISALYALTAHRLNTAYDPDGGETLPANVPAAMSAFFLSGVVNQNYSKLDVIDEIKDERPVLCAGASNANNTIGHSYLIDGYQWRIDRETEYIYDMQGHLLEQNVYYNDYFVWHYNSGDSPSYSFWGAENYYYPYNRILHLGWTQ